VLPPTGTSDTALPVTMGEVTTDSDTPPTAATLADADASPPVGCCASAPSNVHHASRASGDADGVTVGVAGGAPGDGEALPPAAAEAGTPNTSTLSRRSVPVGE
jgi:hypothetical protein